MPSELYKAVAKTAWESILTNGADHGALADLMGEEGMDPLIIKWNRAVHHVLSREKTISAPWMWRVVWDGKLYHVECRPRFKVFSIKQIDNPWRHGSGGGWSMVTREAFFQACPADGVTRWAKTPRHNYYLHDFPQPFQKGEPWMDFVVERFCEMLLASKAQRSKPKLCDRQRWELSHCAVSGSWMIRIHPRDWQWVNP